MASLSGRADATLVKAATDAAMANVPVDVSRINERVSRSYTAMTKSVGKAWVSAITAVGAIGAKLVENAKKDKNKPQQKFENQKGSEPKKFPQIDTKINSNVKVKELKVVDPTKEGGFPTPTNSGLTINPRALKDFTVPDKASFTTWQELPTEFNHTDRDGGSSSITIANTDQFAETLRDKVYKLSGQLDEDLKNIDGNTSYSKEEKLEKKKQIKTDHKRNKNKLQAVKERMGGSNARFAQFYELLSSQLSEGAINVEASGMYGSNKLKFAEALLNNGKPTADGSKAIQGYDEKGDLVFAYVDKNNKPIRHDGNDITLSESEAGSFLVQQSPQRPIFDGLIDLKEIRKDYEYGMGNFSSNINRAVDENVKDKKTFLDLAFYQSENTDSSLADTLHSVKYNGDRAPIIDSEDPTDLASVFITALADIPKANGKHPYDTDGDGDFDEGDYDNERNYMALVKKALSGDDLNLGKSLLKKHLELQTAGHIDDAFNKNNPVVEATVANSLTSKQEATVASNPVVNYSDPKQFNYLNKSGNIGFLNKSNDGKTYVSGKAAKTKLDEIRGAEKGDIITHWQGSNTVRYVRTEFGMFIQEKYNAEKGGFEAEQDKTRQDYGKQMTTQDVEKDMNFPNAMLQTIIEKNGKKYKKVEGGYIEIK